MLSKTFCYAMMVSLIAAVGACGGGDDGPPTMVNTSSATSTISQTANFGDALAGSDGASAAGAIQSLGASAQGIVQLDPGQASLSIDEGDTANATGTCDCDENGCTFTDCGDDGGTWTMNGSISTSGDTYTIDLSMDMNVSGYMYSWDYDGSITITDTQISGNLSGDGDATFSQEGGGGDINISWSWDVDYNDVQLDAQGCATGGSIDSSVSYDAGSSQGGGNFSGSGSVTFGPACGDVTAG